MGWNSSAGHMGDALGPFVTGILLVWVTWRSILIGSSIPGLGMARTLWVTAAVNLLLGSAAIVLARRRPAVSVAPEPADGAWPARTRTPWRTRVVLWAFGLSGFGALVLEVAWTRVLALVMGSSVYAFSLMLVASLIGQGQTRGATGQARYFVGRRRIELDGVDQSTGQSPRVTDGQVYVNDRLLNELYIAQSPAYSGNWTVPEGHVFVLGDNRNSSSDSHVWGVVPLANVIGKAEVIYFPFRRWQNLNPRIAAAAGPTPAATATATAAAYP